MSRAASSAQSPVGVAQQVNRLPEGVHHRGHVLVLPFYRVAISVAASPATPAVDGVDGEALLERQEDRAPPAAVGRCSVHQHEGWAFPTAPVGDLGTVFGRDGFHFPSSRSRHRVAVGSVHRLLGERLGLSLVELLCGHGAPLNRSRRLVGVRCCFLVRLRACQYGATTSFSSVCRARCPPLRQGGSCRTCPRCPCLTGTRSGSSRRPPAARRSCGRCSGPGTERNVRAPRPMPRRPPRSTGWSPR